MKPFIKEVYKNSRFNTTEVVKLIFDSFGGNEDTRRGIAKNPLTPIFILEKLSEDKSSYVRCGIVLNPKPPIHILKQLKRDINIVIAMAAQKILNKIKSK